MTNAIFETIKTMGQRLAEMVLPGTDDIEEVTQPEDGSEETLPVSTAPKYSALKLAQIAAD